MKKDLNSTDWLRTLYPEEGKATEFGREVTIQLTEQCNLRCTYCYQTCKSSERMTSEIGKAIIDLLFKMYDEDKPDAFINKNTKELVLSYIGGEPMLEVDLMEEITDYFWHTAIKKHHPWAETFMVSIASNGTIYFNDKVQRFLNKYRSHMSFSVSIDGTKEMHDACRVFPDGSGSFDLAKAAQDDFVKRYHNSIGTKATIARANLPYLCDIVKYYDSQGFSQIHANCVYEEEWNSEDGALLYQQLKQAADYILALDHELELSFFEENFFHLKQENDLQNWCGGTGLMLAFDPKGDAFPCIRYMHSSLNDDQPPLRIGDCWNGLYYNEETKKIGEMLKKIDRRTQSTDECFYCPIAEGCSWCSGWNYQLYGTPDHRCTRICDMHKARSLANVYFWNKKYIKEKENKIFKRYLSDEESLKYISQEELNMLNELENKSRV